MQVHTFLIHVPLYVTVLSYVAEAALAAIVIGIVVFSTRKRKP